MKRDRLEQAIQKSVIAHICQRGARGLVAIHVPIGGWRSPAEAAILKGMGVRKGAPDIPLWHDGASYALELKTANGRRTLEQCAMLEELHDAGVIVTITYGLDQALEWLEEHGLLKGRLQ